MEPRLTRRQQEVLTFIRTFSQRHGVPPTVREIGERFHVTPRAAFDHLRALERKGYLRRRVHRADLPGPDARRAAARRAAAGMPLQSEENREGPLPLAADWFGARPDELFSLRVRGESMVNAHIVAGDVVVVRRQEQAQPGDIVVALVDGEATVKRFARG